MDHKEILLDQKAFLDEYGIQPAKFEETQLDWDILREIAMDHMSSLPALQSAANYISQRLQNINCIHSLKIRVKDYRHLIAKVIRKKVEDPTLIFDSTTYRNLITDLIGLRALHLFKDEWLPIHKFVVGTWELDEKPKAYIREGDPEKILQGFRAADCEVLTHPLGYRSIHYLLKFKPDKHTYIAELQVRTIFEEGWSEIDHHVRYPRQSDDAYLSDFLAIFNRLSGSADEMGSFIKTLVDFTASQAEKIKELNTKVSENETKLEQAISDLKINQNEKDKLNKIVADLKSSQSTQSQVFLTTIPPTLSHSDLSLARPTIIFGRNSEQPASLGSLLGGLSSRDSTTLHGVKRCSKCESIFFDSSVGGSSSSLLSECQKCRNQFPIVVNNAQ